MADDSRKDSTLTPEEIAKIKKNEQELLDRWIKNLSAEESKVWLDARIEDLETRTETLLRKKTDIEIILRVVAPIVQEHPSMAIGTALDLVREKEQKALAESEALDAFERIIKDTSL